MGTVRSKELWANIWKKSTGSGNSLVQCLSRITISQWVSRKGWCQILCTAVTTYARSCSAILALQGSHNKSKLETGNTAAGYREWGCALQYKEHRLWGGEALYSHSAHLTYSVPMDIPVILIETHFSIHEGENGGTDWRDRVRILSVAHSAWALNPTGYFSTFRPCLMSVRPGNAVAVLWRDTFLLICLSLLMHSFSSFLSETE